MVTVTLNGSPVLAETGMLLSDLIAPHAYLDTPCGGKAAAESAAFMPLEHSAL